jgi:hypothetical protein
LAQTLERVLQERGASLDKPQDLCDSEFVGLILRRQPSGRKFWYFGYSFGGCRKRVKIGNFPALSVDGARKAAKAPAAEIAAGNDPAAKLAPEHLNLSR